MSIIKRVTSLILALVLAMSFSTFAFAAEPVAQVASSTEVGDVSPRATDQLLDMWINQQTKTTSTRSSFTVLGTLQQRMWVQISVNEPCTLYVGLEDSNGKTLGTEAMTMTYAGTFTYDLNPAYLGAGSYTMFYFFNKSGVTYDLLFFATSPY